MVDLVGKPNGETNRAPEKICPLAWAPMMQQGPPGIQLPNAGLAFVAGNCVRERCGWWSEHHERCSMVSIGGLQSHLLEIADQASVAVHRMRPTADELEDAGFRLGKAAALGTVDPPALVNQALDALQGVRNDNTLRDERTFELRARVADELRRLRHTVLGVYAACAELLPGVWMNGDEAERAGREAAGDGRSEDRVGETPGEPG